MKKIRILCILIILSGIGLFVGTSILIPSSAVYGYWSIGLASALIVLGLGYLINTLLISAGQKQQQNTYQRDHYNTYIKEKAGYLDCKIMNILLCIYLLILNEMQVNSMLLVISIFLVVIQFLLDLFFQIYFIKREDARKNEKGAATH